MKIAVVCFTGNTGLTDYSVSLCRELAKQSDVIFITADSYNSKKYGVDFLTFKLFRRTRHYPIDLLRLIFYIYKNQPEVLLFQSWLKIPMFEAFCVKLFQLFGCKVAITIHDLLPHYPKFWSGVEMRFFYRQFDRVIVHSHRQKDSLHALGVHTKPLVVPHGVYEIFNTELLTMKKARTFFPKLKEDDYIVLFFGFLGERKGVIEFMQCADLLRDNKSIKLLIAGQPENKSSIIDMIKSKQNVDNLVIYNHTIPHNEVQRYFSACDLVALPYTEGTTSGVLKLAMAFSKPVICTDVGDFVETLEKWPGVIIGKDDLAKELAFGIKEAFYRKTELAKRTSVMGTEFSWGNITDKYLDYLGDYLKQNKQD